MIGVRAIFVAIPTDADGHGGECHARTGGNRLALGLDAEYRAQMLLVHRVPGQNVFTFGPGKTIDSDLILLSTDNIEISPAGIKATAIFIAVDGNQVADIGAGVNSQQGIEGTAKRAKGRDASYRRNPGVPNGLAAHFSGVPRYAGFKGRTMVLPSDQTAKTFEGDAV